MSRRSAQARRSRGDCLCSRMKSEFSTMLRASSCSSMYTLFCVMPVATRLNFLPSAQNRLKYWMIEGCPNRLCTSSM